MAQIATTDIMAGSSRSVGSLSVDAGLIRGEAGPLEPRLVIPLTVEMYNRPAEEMLAVTYITGHLHLGDPVNAATQVGFPARSDLIPGFHARSLPEGKLEHHLELRCQLSPAAVERLEDVRHASTESLFTLHLRCELGVAWLQKTWGAIPSSHGLADDPFGLRFGLHSQLSHLWTVAARPLRIQIEQSAWIENVLPGFGMDRVRLLEVAFPTASAAGPSAARAFSDALRAFNEKRYEECISKCRTIVATWNTKLGATRAKPMGEIIGGTQGWPPDDPRINWLNGLWQSLIDMSNAAHHPESRSADHVFAMHEAKLHLMMAAAVSEYLGALVA